MTKPNNFIVFFIFLFALFIFLVSCGGEGDTTTATPVTTTPGTTTSVTPPETTEKPDPLAKINPRVYEYSERKGDKYGVYVHLEVIPVNVIEQTLYETTGYRASDYRVDSYYTVLLPRIKADLVKELEREPTEDELNAAVNEELDRYGAARRNVIKDLHEALYNEFLAKHPIPSEDILYRGSASTLILYATKEELELMAQNDAVVSIDDFQNAIAAPDAE